MNMHISEFRSQFITSINQSPEHRARVSARVSANNRGNRHALGYRKLSAEQIAGIVGMREGGAPWTEIAAAFNSTAYAVRKQASRHGHPYTETYKSKVRERIRENAAMQIRLRSVNNAEEGSRLLLTRCLKYGARRETNGHLEISTAQCRARIILMRLAA